MHKEKMGAFVTGGRSLMLYYRPELCFGALLSISSTSRMPALLLVILMYGLIVVGTEG
jgi:hypothetical protein